MVIIIIILLLLIQVLRSKKIFKKKIDLESIEDEIILSLNHNNIVKLEKVILFNDFKVLHLRDFECGPISTFSFDNIENFQKWEVEVKNITFQLLDAINYLHKNKITHTDINPDNILYNKKSKKIMLIDFESAAVAKKFIPKELGYLYYISPEKVYAFNNKKYVNNKIDIYSVGCILHVLLTGKTVYSSTRPENIDYEKNGIFYDDLQVYSNDCIDLLYRMLDKSPKTRISAKDSLLHNWFKKKL